MLFERFGVGSVLPCDGAAFIEAFVFPSRALDGDCCSEALNCATEVKDGIDPLLDRAFWDAAFSLEGDLGTVAGELGVFCRVVVADAPVVTVFVREAVVGAGKVANVLLSLRETQTDPPVTGRSTCFGTVRSVASSLLSSMKRSAAALCALLEGFRLRPSV